LLEKVSEVKKYTPAKKTSIGVRVRGMDNLLIRLSKCCNPVPGDQIIGFITKGRGVSIHRADCQNILTEDSQTRLLPVEWEGNTHGNKNYNVDIEISGYDRRGLLNEVLHAVTETRTNMNAVSGKTDKNKMATILMTISIHNVDHLQIVVERIKRISDIYSVRRIMH
jgi:guanosine-3',5'-bis(diphosphate) 3'-pyrophosphohydrolase